MHAESYCVDVMGKAFSGGKPPPGLYGKLKYAFSCHHNAVINFYFQSKTIPQKICRDAIITPPACDDTLDLPEFNASAQCVCQVASANCGPEQIRQLAGTTAVQCRNSECGCTEIFHHRTPACLWRDQCDLQGTDENHPPDWLSIHEHKPKYLRRG